MTMKWGGKKSSPSSFGASMITRLFPGSWFSKLKQKGGDPETQAANKKQRGKLDYPASYSIFTPVWREGIFYGVDDDDAYWRLSFRGDRVEGRRSTGGINPLWYDSGDESQLPVSCFRSLSVREMGVPRREEHLSFKDMALDMKRMKERQQHKANVLQENGAFRREKPNGEAQFSTSKKKYVNDRCSRKLSHRVVRKREAELGRKADEGEEEPSRLVEREIFPVESENMEAKAETPNSAVSHSRTWQNLSFSNSSLCSTEEGLAFAALNSEEINSTSEKVSISDGQNLKDKKKKTRTKSKSAHVSRQSRSRKIKKNAETYSPKTEFRIRVLEDMKRARMKSRKNERMAEGGTIFDSFAVAKSSINPQQDFRDSMIEMIREKGIKQPEELEELLACYLTLNCDGQHDLIIKVFLEVCYELNKDAHRS